MGDQDEVIEQPGEGVDRLDFAAYEYPIDIDLGDSALQTLNSLQTLTITGADAFEQVTGSPFDDQITGNTADNSLAGGPGDDTLYGRGGSNTLAGGAGDDTYIFAGIASYWGTDTLVEVAGEGSDTLDFSTVSSSDQQGLVLDLSAVNAQTAIPASGSFALNFGPLADEEIEHVIGTSYDDLIAGNDRANTLEGGPGDDALFGRAGDDLLEGGDGNDTLRGGRGTDTLRGGNGFDDPEIADNAESRFAATSGFTTQSGAGFDGGYSRAEASSNSEAATWSLSGLPTGSYEVSVTWPAAADLATAATYEVLVDQDPPVTRVLNQTERPAGPRVADRSWASLGVYSVTAGSIDVTLESDPLLAVAADAVLVRAVAPDGTPLTLPGEISGTKFHDLDLGGVQADQPNLVFVVDVSNSSLDVYGPVDDVNGDQVSTTRLDAELASLIELNRTLIEQGLGDTVSVSIVIFAETAQQLDLDPAPGDPVYWMAPNAGADANSRPYVERALRNIRRGGGSGEPLGVGTSVEAGLQGVISALEQLSGPDRNDYVFFLSDGDTNPISSYEDEVAQIHQSGAVLRVFGPVNGDADSLGLRAIDPTAQTYADAAELIGLFADTDPSSRSLLELPLEDWLFYLDENDNGIRDGSEPFWVTDETGRYAFRNLAAGDYVVREQPGGNWSGTGAAHTCAARPSFCET